MSVKKMLKKYVQKEGIKFLKKNAIPLIKKQLDKRKGGK